MSLQDVVTTALIIASAAFILTRAIQVFRPRSQANCGTSCNGCGGNPQAPPGDSLVQLGATSAFSSGFSDSRRSDTDR